MGAGLVVLSVFSTWAVAGGMPLPPPTRAETELADSASKATTRSDHDTATHRSFDCVDPGHCGGFTRSSTEPLRDDDLAERTFAFSWASDWNRWAEAHMVPQQILRVGCHYVSTEHYYLCAIRVSSGLPASGDPPSAPGTSCGLIVVSAKMQAGPNDRIVNGLKTTCDIFSTYPRQPIRASPSQEACGAGLTATSRPVRPCFATPEQMHSGQRS